MGQQSQTILLFQNFAPPSCVVHWKKASTDLGAEFPCWFVLYCVHLFASSAVRDLETPDVRFLFLVFYL